LSIAGSLSNRFEAAAKRSAVWLGKTALSASIIAARAVLNNRDPIKILLDNSVVRLGVTHTTILHSHELKFGPTVSTVEIPYRAVVKLKDKDRKLSAEQKFLPGLAKLGVEKRLEFFTSSELQRERFCHQLYKYSGTSLGTSWFATDWVKHVEAPAFRQFSKIMTRYDFTTDEQRDFILSISDTEFVYLKKLFQEKHCADAFHFWTACRSGCDVFLTVDGRLVRMFETLRKQNKLSSFSTRILLPSSLAKEIKLMPIDLKHLTPEHVFGMVDYENSGGP
jgi:hypothetical protein